MKATVDCFGCIAKNVKVLAARLTDDAQKQKAIQDAVAQVLDNSSLDVPPPYLGQQVHRAIRRASKIKDPYLAEKKKSTRIALDAYPELKGRIGEGPESFRRAVKIAIAGNIIDFGVGKPMDLMATVKRMLSTEPAIDNIAELQKAIEPGAKILFLGDNAGETVTDRILIEQFPKGVETVYAVRGGPVLNDALEEDAKAAGIDQLAEIISNGSDAPGTLLEDCTPEFKKLFDEADLIISKGMGNFESLWKSTARPIAFLLIAKCEYVAQHIGCDVGDAIVVMNAH